MGPAADWGWDIVLAPWSIGLVVFVVLFVSGAHDDSEPGEGES